jgi:flagellar biosynthetic protein FliR
LSGITAVELIGIEFFEFLQKSLIPFCRISAALAFFPIFSNVSVPVTIRVGLSALLTLVAFTLYEFPLINPLSGQGFQTIVAELLVGAGTGLILQFMLAALLVAGQAISSTMGLSMANLIDPNFGNAPILSGFLVVIATFIFLGLGGHVVVIGLIFESFTYVPIAIDVMRADGIQKIISASTFVFTASAAIALPSLIFLLAVNFGFGVVTRASPALNIFAIGFPMILVLGLAFLLLSVGGLTSRMQGLWMETFDLVRVFLADSK